MQKKTSSLVFPHVSLIFLVSHTYPLTFLKLFPSKFPPFLNLMFLTLFDSLFCISLLFPIRFSHFCNKSLASHHWMGLTNLINIQSLKSRELGEGSSPSPLHWGRGTPCTTVCWVVDPGSPEYLLLFYPYGPPFPFFFPFLFCRATYWMSVHFAFPFPKPRPYSWNKKTPTQTIHPKWGDLNPNRTIKTAEINSFITLIIYSIGCLESC